MLEGAPLRNWQLSDLRRRHAVELVDVLLRKQRRSASGAQNLLRTLSAMCEDAIAMELAEVNPFKGVRVRADDPRVTKPARKAPVFTFAQMHAFAKAGGVHEAMLRVLSDCGLRLGELLGLERADWDGDVLRVRLKWRGASARIRTTSPGIRSPIIHPSLAKKGADAGESSKVHRASQAEGRGFDPRRPLATANWSWPSSTTTCQGLRELNALIDRPTTHQEAAS